MKGLLSYDSLHKICYDFFCAIPDHRANNISISLPDIFMSAVAVFQFKYPSLLCLDQGRTNKEVSNLKTLFNLKKIPSDTCMREVLDEISPANIQGLFEKLLSEVSKSGKLDHYKVLGDYFLCPMDGVEFFSSSAIHCDCCQQKKLRDGRICYSHAMLSAVMVKPGEAVVLPLDCEPINKQDGESKNDHELVAAKRLWERLWERHKDWKFLHTGDALFANGPMIREIIGHGHSFLLNVKPDSHKVLFEHYNNKNNAYAYQIYTMHDGDERITVRCCHNLPLNGSAGDVRVNFIVATVTRKNGTKTTFSWVTNLKITSKNVLTIVRCARGRWKIENETFNTLKNQGYNFEHNYGHGKKHLANLLATLMMIVFLIDQIQQLSNKVFIKLLCLVKTKTKLWEQFRAAFRLKELNSMKHLLDFLFAEHSLSSA
jgi:Transposase DDE domain